MTSRTPKLALFFLVVTLGASMILSGKLARLRAQQTIQAEQAQRAGFGKFLSQIRWMQLIQLRGGMEKVTPENVGLLIRKYDDLTALDPLFVQAYEEGAFDISWQNPKESLRLLDKALQVDQLKSWKVPFTAGFIAKMRLNDPERAVEYLELAAKSPNSPAYVQRYLINLKSDMYRDDPAKVLNLWVDYYNGGTGRFADMAIGGRQLGSDPDRKVVLKQIHRVSSQIIADAQQNEKNEKTLEGKKAQQDRIEQTYQILNSIGVDLEASRGVALDRMQRLYSNMIAQAQKDLAAEKNPFRKKMLQDGVDQTRKILSQIEQDQDHERDFVFNRVHRLYAETLEQLQKELSLENDPARKKKLGDYIDQTRKILRDMDANARGVAISQKNG